MLNDFIASVILWCSLTKLFFLNLWGSVRSNGLSIPRCHRYKRNGSADVLCIVSDKNFCRPTSFRIDGFIADKSPGVNSALDRSTHPQGWNAQSVNGPTPQRIVGQYMRSLGKTQSRGKHDISQWVSGYMLKFTEHSKSDCRPLRHTTQLHEHCVTLNLN